MGSGLAAAQFIAPPSIGLEEDFRSLIADDRMVAATYPEASLSSRPFVNGPQLGDVTLAYSQRYVDGELCWERFDRLVVESRTIYSNDYNHSIDGNRIAIASPAGVSVFDLDLPAIGRIYVDAGSAQTAGDASATFSTRGKLISCVLSEKSATNQGGAMYVKGTSPLLARSLSDLPISSLHDRNRTRRTHPQKILPSQDDPDRRLASPSR